MTAPDPRQSTTDEVTHDRGTKLPHDRDEAAKPEADTAQRDHNRTIVRQAHEDVERGLVDTERVGTPNDVPASKPKR
jgi:hypothetical protein